MPNGKPNILIIWGDDIGISNLICYSDGLMGYRTPNIDRVANEGMRFIHYYGEQSCTAGRAAFITGQSVFRSGLSKVGLPGAPQGFRAEDPSTAELLKPLGYRTGQFGKNHFGDRDEHLPTIWEGAYRVPAMVRWPGKVEAGSVCNGIVSHLDWLPTLLAAAGEPEIKQKLLDGHPVGNKTFKIHLDGYNMLDYWTGKTDKSPRSEFFYFSDDGDLTGLRYDNWKFIFAEQRVTGTLKIWSEPFVMLRCPKLFNLVTDPYERADITSNTYYDWALDHTFLVVPAQAFVAQFLQTFKDYPPRQKAASFSIEQAMEKLEVGLGST